MDASDHAMSGTVDAVPTTGGTGIDLKPCADQGNDPRLRQIRHLGWVLLGLQLVAMIVFSAIEYHRYALSVGFGTYSQGWVGIAHGHLDPFSTLIGKPFWRNDAEFMVWPLSLLYHVYPHPIDLLWIQDVVLVLTEAVTLGWIVRVIETARSPLPGRLGPALALGAVCAIVVDPFAYQSIAYDFHSEILSALFVVLAGRALWAGKKRQLWWWVPLALATNGLSGLYLVGVGISGMLAGARTRRIGLLVVASGISWVLIVSLLGGNEFGYSHSLSGWYGYLIGPHHGPVRSYDVVAGVLTHPLTALHMALSKWAPILDFLLAVGLVGVVSSWGWPMALVVIVPSALNSSPSFLNPHASFQTWPALPFVLVGSFMVLVRMAQGTARDRLILRAVGAVWAVSLVVVAGVLIPNVWRFFLAVDGPASSELARVDARIPSNAEVIASWGVVGRFGIRNNVYAYGPQTRSFPVGHRPVVFVLTPGQGIYEVSKARAERAVARVESLAGAHVLAASDDVFAIEWVPPPTVRRVVLP
jgi:hypothetical protein